MGPYTAKVWRDDVTLMNKLIERLKDRVPGLRWLRPLAQDNGHLLVWDGGQHEEERLGLLCDWAEAEWPP